MEFPILQVDGPAGYLKWGVASFSGGSSWALRGIPDSVTLRSSSSWGFGCFQCLGSRVCDVQKSVVHSCDG